MTQVGTVGSLWRYPVKSMLGDDVTSAEVVENGIVGDRWWAVRDEVRGGIRGAKKIGQLMTLHARYVDEPAVGGAPPAVEIVAPDGTATRSDAVDVHDAVSSMLDHKVTLWPLRPADDLDHYRRGAPDTDDFLAEMRSMFGRDEDEPLPTLAGLPLDVIGVYESPPGTYFDCFPIHLLTDRSMASIAAKTPGAEVDVRRFRPNVVVNVGADVEGDYPEAGWLGRRVTLGDVELEITADCPRCVMTTRATGDLPQDRSVLRTIIRDADQNLGVYAKVLRAGVVRAGDTVSLG